MASEFSSLLYNWDCVYSSYSRRSLRSTKMSIFNQLFLFLWFGYDKNQFVIKTAIVKSNFIFKNLYQTFYYHSETNGRYTVQYLQRWFFYQYGHFCSALITWWRCVCLHQWFADFSLLTYIFTPLNSLRLFRTFPRPYMPVLFSLPLAGTKKRSPLYCP